MKATIVGLCLMGGWAPLAGASPHASPRHPLAACMTKRMMASRSVSYNEASRECKAELKAPVPTYAATRPAADAPRPGTAQIDSR